MWEKEKLLVTSNFSFSHDVFKSCLVLMRQNEYLLSKGLRKSLSLFQNPLRQAHHTRHNSADSVPTSNLVCIKEVTIRTTFCVAGVINYTCYLVTDIQCTRYENAFNKRFSRIVCPNNSSKIYSEKILSLCNAVYFRLCIDLMHITPPVTAEGFDGSHHPRYAE